MVKYNQQKKKEKKRDMVKYLGEIPFNVRVDFDLLVIAECIAQINIQVAYSS